MNDTAELHSRYPTNCLETIRQPTSNHLTPKTPALKLPGTPQEWKLLINKYLPITSWLPAYSPKSLIIGDLLAAITITVICIPQGMAYAAMAKLPVVYGLYSAVFPPIVYAIFGTSRECSLGITAIPALILASSFVGIADPIQDASKYLDLCLLTSIVSGILALIGGFLNMGYAVSFIAPSAIGGFTTGSAFVIFFSQLEGLFATKALDTPASQHYSIIKSIQILISLKNFKWIALVNGLVCITIIFLMKKFTPKLPNAIVVAVISTITGFLVHTRTGLGDLLPVVGFIPNGAPTPHLPDFSNITSTLSPAFLVLIISYLQSIAICTKYSDMQNYALEPSQELIALGMSKFVGGFFLSPDVAGSFTRTAINYQVGAKSQVSGVFMAIFVLLALQFLTPLFFYIPKSTLSAIVLMATLSLFELRSYIAMYKVNVLDFLVGILTATITFFISVPVGLASGTGISLLFILYRISKPHWAILGEMVIRTGDHTSERVWRNIKRYQDTTEYPGILVWRFDSSLYFVNVRYWRDVLMKVCAERINGKDLDICPNSIDHVILHEQPSPTTITMPKHIPVKFVILDFSPVNDIDISGANTILHAVENIERKFHVKVLFSGVKGPVRDMLWLRCGGIPPEDNDEDRILTADRFFLSNSLAVDYCSVRIEKLMNNE